MTQLAQTREAFSQATDPNMKAALQRDIDALCVEAAFDELTMRDPQGRLIGEAREQLRRVEPRLASAPDVRMGLCAVIQLAIDYGAPIYNAGSAIGCAYIYDYAARIVLRSIDGISPRHPLPRVKTRIGSVSFQPITPMGADQRAWELRHAFDQVLGMLAETEPEAARKAVFVSYAVADAGEAQRIVGLLEADGIPCWIAPRDVPTGANYGGAIMDAIKTTVTTLVLLSAHANASGFIPNEVERAVSYKKRIVTVRLENVQPSGDLELFIGPRQWTDVFEGDPRREQNLLGLIAKLRAEHAAAKAATPSD